MVDIGKVSESLNAILMTKKGETNRKLPDYANEDLPCSRPT